MPDSHRQATRASGVIALIALAAIAPVSAGSAVVDRELFVQLVGWQPLPVATRARLAEEVRKIWQQHGVQVEGFERPGSAPERLRVELTNDDDGDGGRGATLTHELGAFNRAEGVVTISLPTAVRVAIDGVPMPESLSWPDIRRDYALGSVLGRAIAHEIGHYILGPRHMPSGLMHAAFRPSELVDPQNAAFALTRLDVARLIAVSSADATIAKAQSQREPGGPP